ncbi:MAG: DUF2269 family protein [Actinomycetota bacterium]
MLAFNDNIYNTLKFVHVLAAITWLGSAVYAQVLATRVLREKDPAHLGVVAKDIGVAGKTLLMPASITVLVFGILLILYSPAWNFGQTWVLVGLGGIVLTIITGAGFLGPGSERLGKLMAEGHSPAEPEIEQRIRKIVGISRIDLVVLIVVVADMVFKPGL